MRGFPSASCGAAREGGRRHLPKDAAPTLLLSHNGLVSRCQKISGAGVASEREDGTPADPSTFHTVVPTWQPGDTIPLGAGRALRVIVV
jgi:hypothetical protein